MSYILIRFRVFNYRSAIVFMKNKYFTLISVHSYCKKEGTFSRHCSAQMSLESLRKLIEDHRSWNENHPAGFSANPMRVGEKKYDFYNWVCYIPGAKESSWEGGLYQLLMCFPESYPCTPPRCTFIPPLFHPNIHASGVVQWSFLDSSKQWVQSMKIGDILVGLQQLLAEPCLDEVVHNEAYTVLCTDPAAYDFIIQQLAKKFKPVT